MTHSISVLPPSTSTTATTSQSTSTASSSMLTTAASTSLVPVPEQATPVALPLKPILHQITRDLTILTCSYLTFAEMFRMIVNKDSARAFSEPQGMIVAGYNNQLESENGPCSPLSLYTWIRSVRLAHSNEGPKLSAEKIRSFAFHPLANEELDDALMKDIVTSFPKLRHLKIGPYLFRGYSKTG